MNTMTPEHERWEEFVEMLEGPVGCDFKDDEEKGKTWRCAGGKNKDYASVILLGFEVNVPASLAYFESHGGYCDCEVLFNVA